MRRLMLCVGTLLLAAGCQDYLFRVVPRNNIKEQQVVVPAAQPTPADILFVVDNSCSMEDEQANLGRNFDAFINQIVGTGDYRIAIVSTDVRGGANGFERAGLRVSSFKGSDPNTLQTINDQSCVETDIRPGCFRGPGAPETRVITSTLAGAEQIRLFNQNVAIGSCGDGVNEAGLAAMKLALDNTRAGRCNEGFLRPEANLVVVFVSDENDIDPMSTAIGNYVNDLKAFKGGDASKVRVAAIVGSQDGAARNCRPGGATCGGTCQRRPPDGSGATGCVATPSLCPSDEFCDRGTDSCQNRDLQFFDEFCFWCSYYNTEDCCSALSGDRYVDFALAMETEVMGADASITATGCQPGEGDERIACLIDSVCQDSFSETLRKIARDLINPGTYDLAPPACNPAGVVVKLDGVKQTNGSDFVISDDGGTLTFTGTKPTSEQNVEIFFVVDGCGAPPES